MDYTNYTNYIDNIINNNITTWNFKSNDTYTFILEHVDYGLGTRYLNFILSYFNKFYNDNKDILIKLCHDNDSIGQPNKYNFNNFTICSATNLRYIMHSLIILEYINKCNLNNIDIVEIGGGYGGLCFFINNLATLFNIKINSYSIFDLKEVLKLQEKYLAHLNIDNINFEHIDNIKNVKYNSFLISNYAFSEITMDKQINYTEKLLNPYISHGFLSWNAIPVYKFIDNKEINVIDEIPLSGGEFNKYVFFKPL